MKHIESILFFLTLFLVGCTTSKSTVSQSADLSAYEYAMLADVMYNNAPPQVMDADVKIYDAIDASRLKMVGEQELYNLTHEQRKQLLLARYTITQTGEETVVSVNFVDYFTGRPIASCRGAYGMGMDHDADYNGAMKKLAAQIKATFPKD
jgi:hypothetical protein